MAHVIHAAKRHLPGVDGTWRSAETLCGLQGGWAFGTYRDYPVTITASLVTCKRCLKNRNLKP